MDEKTLRAQITLLVLEATTAFAGGSPVSLGEIVNTPKAQEIINKIMGLTGPFTSSAAQRVRNKLYQWHNATARCVCEDCRLVREWGSNDPERQIESEGQRNFVADLREVINRHYPMHDLRKLLGVYLDEIVITSDNIGSIRRTLSMPFDSEWNAIVRDETAKRENAVT